MTLLACQWRFAKCC